jgi:hypothetical protein
MSVKTHKVKAAWKKHALIDNDGYLKMYKQSVKNPENYNCVDRHLKKRGDQTAIIWEGDNPYDDKKITYKELYEQVCRLSNVMKSNGVKKGDRVTIYMPMIPEAAYAMLAVRAHRCHAHGGVRRLLAGCAEGPHPVRECCASSRPMRDMRGGKTVPLKFNTDRMNAEDPLFILYTSGSTGKPKGVLHTTGGYLSAGRDDPQVRVRLPRRRRVLVHRRRRLGHRPQLHRLRPAGQRRHHADVRGRADLSGCGPLLGASTSTRSTSSTPRPPRSAPSWPRATTVKRYDREACAARFGRRADQPGGLEWYYKVVGEAAARSSTPGGRPKPAAS